jgi:hypothetical protein
MSKGKRYLSLPLILATAAFLGCNDEHPTEPAGPDIDPVMQAAKGGGKPNPELAGNNLSYPVIWAEGVAKVLPGTPGMAPIMGGVWWYQWGTNGVDPDIAPASCPPDPDAGDLALNPDGLPLCDDGILGAVDLGRVAGTPAAQNPLPLAKAYMQKDPLNSWQAWSGDAAESGQAELTGEIFVDWIDWGDNLESVDWYTRSQVRTEVVLFEDFFAPKLEYQMRHTDGWGINEVHGLAATLDASPAALLGDGMRGTVYSPCARLTIQKLLVKRDDADLVNLVWVPGTATGGGYWVESDLYQGDPLINAPIFNLPVYQGGDGPGYYSAEINVKGRVIFGYTWNVRRLNEGAGDYRATFSLDEICGSTTLNTRFVDGHTQILVPLEEEALAAPVTLADEGSDTGGGTPVLVTSDNLTYIDIRILERGGGGSKGGGTKGGGAKGGGNH